MKSTIEEILGINVDTLLPTLLEIDSSLILIDVETIKKDLQEIQEALKIFLLDIGEAYSKLDLSKMNAISDDLTILDVLDEFENHLQELDHIAELMHVVSNPTVPDGTIPDGPGLTWTARHG